MTLTDKFEFYIKNYKLNKWNIFCYKAACCMNVNFPTDLAITKFCLEKQTRNLSETQQQLQFTESDIHCWINIASYLKETTPLIGIAQQR